MEEWSIERISRGHRELTPLGGIPENLEMMLEALKNLEASSCVWMVGDA